MNERLGIFDGLQARTQSFAERHPALRRFFQGKGPDHSSARNHFITVNCKTGAVTATSEPASRPDPAYKNMPSIRAIMLQQEAQQFLAAKRGPRVKPGPKWPPLDYTFAASVVQAVCDAWNIDDWRVMSPSRESRTVYPRFAVMLILNQRTECSLPAIGNFLRRDHTTCLAGIRRARALFREDPEWRANYDHANALLDEAANGSGGPA